VKRYKVVTTEGWQIRAGRGGTSYPPGLTASVLDTKNIHREVKRFRSEDRAAKQGGATIGVEGARQAAQEYADKLNAECGHT
jgi:hypothetical protein